MKGITPLLFAVVLVFSTMSGPLTTVKAEETVNNDGFTVSESEGNITIKATNYKVDIEKDGFKYAFKKSDGTVIADAHAISGIQFTTKGGTTPYDAEKTKLVNYDDDKAHFEVMNTNGDRADVFIFPNEYFAKFKIKPIDNEENDPGEENNQGYVYHQSNNSGEALTWTGETTWKNYTVEGDVKQALSSNSASGLLFRYQDYDNFYHLRLNGGEKKLQLLKKVNGSFSVLDQIDFNIAPDQWYHLKVVVDNNTIKGYVNGEEKLNYTNSNNELSHGAIGVRVWRDEASVKNITVTSEDNVLFKDDFQDGNDELWQVLHGEWSVQKEIRPDNYTIDARTSSLSPVYGLGDHGGYSNSTNVFGISDHNFHDTDNGKRFVSNFSVFPKQEFAQVLFEDGKKRVVINNTENKLGAAEVKQVNKLYYFMGDMEQIYKDYQTVRFKEGYEDFKPKYEWFEIGYEAFGSLGWNTYQTSVMDDLSTYLEEGYPIKWGVIGSGFWKGDRNNNDQGATTSFGIWDDEHQDGRNDGLPNPRYPDVAGLKHFFQENDMKLLLGLRINFKALPEDGGYYNAVNDGEFTKEGLEHNYFMKDDDGNFKTFNVNFPTGKVHFLDGNNPAALDWYKAGVDRWGVDGFKEDTMLGNGSQLYDDAKVNNVNAKLKQSGYYMMVRNSAYSVPGDIIRLEDTQHGFDQDRPIINGLNYAASGAANVYPDIVGGKYLTYPLTQDQKDYFVRNAMFSAVSPVMSMGLGPWHLDQSNYEEIIKKAADWHSRYAPYIYSAAVDSFDTGFPYTMTPLPIAYPQDANTYDHANKTTRQYAWMLGPSLLATPAYGNDYATVETRDVYLPEGKWIDYESGDVYHGPTTLEEYEIPKHKVPVFVGGKGVLVSKDQQDSEKLKVEVYPVAKSGSKYTYTYIDGKTTSTITNDNEGWDPDTMIVIDQTTGTIVSFSYHEKSGSFAFSLNPGHDYKLIGGGETSAADLKTLVERFEVEGEFADHGSARSLQVHLIAVDRFEKQEATKKVIKHMEGFKLLLDYQKENELISEKAYHTLSSHADHLLNSWLE